MNKQPTRRRRAARRATARTLAVAAAMAALVATLGGRPGPGRAGRACPGAPSQDRQPSGGQPGRQAGQSGGALPGLADTVLRGGSSGPSRPWIPVPGSTPTSSSSPPRRRRHRPATGLAWSSAWRSPPCSWRLSPPRPGGSTTAVPDLSRPPERPAGPPARSAGRGRRPTRRPRPALATLSAGGVARPGACFDQTSQGVRKPMSTAKVFRVACLALGLALLGASCAGPHGTPAADGVRGGTLRVLTAEPTSTLDTAGASTAPRSRAPTPGPCTATTSPGPPEQATVPVPDIASRPTPALGRPAHLHLHPAPRGPLRPPGRPRGHRPRLHHRHPAALRQDEPRARAAVRGPHRRRQQRSVPGRPAASRG